MKFDEIKNNKEILAFLKKGNENLGVLGYTDHSEAHCILVADRAAHILKTLGYKEKEIEFARIAGFMHDIGNAVNRDNHAEYRALLANEILKNTNLSLTDRVNYAVTSSKLRINTDKKSITLNLQIDENICTMYDYFDIFLGRMMMCRKAAEILGFRFKLTANGSKVL